MAKYAARVSGRNRNRKIGDANTIAASVAKLDEYGCVVRRLLALARVAVDAARDTALGERGREQDVIDAQAVVLREREHAVVPPRERHRRLLEESEAVVQSDVEQRLERRTLGLGAVDLAGPQHGIVHVAILGGHVEVAGDRERAMALQFVAQHVGERRVPRELVRELLRADRLPVERKGDR